MSLRIGPYELIDRFAVGGVAEIYRARDTRNGEVVVIKRMREDKGFDPEMQAGFLREMQVAMKADHKNLIKGLELAAVNNVDYGVLEYVDGQDLESVLDRARRLGVQIPPQFATFIVSEILDGLDFAHHITDHNQEPLGLVHRDLAPKNIFLRYDGQIRVADFGLSLATRQERAEEIVGTPGYLAPEQARGAVLDCRTDIFAAGCILYDLVVGQRAFEVAGLKDTDMIKLHGAGRHRPVPHDVPEQLGLLIEVALALDPADRFQTAADMRRALRSTEYPPDDAHTPLGLATMLRKLFEDEFKRTRLPGNPLPFLSS
jgi:eukaryotic-like serine/threonine-protein kinase